MDACPFRHRVHTFLWHPHAAVELLGCGEEQGWEWVRARVLGLLPGCADVEVQHGNFLRWDEGWEGGWVETLREGGCVKGLSNERHACARAGTSGQ